MIRAYHLYTGSDGNSHVVRGSVSGGNWSKRNPSSSRKRRHIHRLTGTMIQSAIRHYLGWCTRKPLQGAGAICGSNRHSL